MFFNDAYANIVQLVSLPLEAVGFALAFIEIRWPKKALQFEEYLDRKYEHIIEKRRAFVGVIIEASHVAIASTKSFLKDSMPRLYTTEEFKQELASFKSRFTLYFKAYYYFFLVSFIIKPQKDILRGLNNIADGRAVGGIGLSLAFLGLLGETYQVITMAAG